MSTTVNADFAYPTLPDEHDLRLLCIDDWTSESTLKCHLVSEPFEEASRKSYCALSYCWGNEPFTTEIDIDGRPFFVKPNAFQALKAVCAWIQDIGAVSKKRGLHLWIDAICINQNDNAEKSSQVKRMDRVYSNALHTLIWLGAAEDDSDKVTAVISHAGWKFQKSQSTLKHQISKSLRSLVKSHESEYQKRLANELENKFDISKSQIDLFVDLIERIEIARPVEAHYQTLFNRRDDPLPFPSQDTFWQSAICLFSRPWFSRIWTFQEGILGRKAMVLCGQYWVDWPLFRRWRFLLVDWMTRALVAGQVKMKKPPNTLMSTPYDRALIGNGLQALRNILILDSSTRQASVKKDYIYGYLGIVGSILSDSVLVDYDAPDWIVFAQTAKLIVEGRNGAIDWSVIHDSIPVQTTQPIQDLPSWCPDFACRGASFTEDFYLGTELQGRIVRDEVFEQLAVEEPTAVTDDLKMLTIPGHVLDTIHHTSDFVFPPCPNADTRKQMWEQQDQSLIQQWLLGLERMCERSSMKYPDSILSFFFERTDGAFDDATIKSHQRLPQFQHMLSLFQRSADVKGYEELTHRFQDIPTEDIFHEDRKAFTNVELFMDDMRRTRVCNRGRYFFTTKEGRLGFCSRAVQEGQLVCYLPGSYFFKILSAERENVNKLVGIASVEGIMGKELIRLCSEPEREQTFHIY